MKAQILKISGHKNLKDFYKEFPDEASFKAKYGKELKKAQYGNMLQGVDTGLGTYNLMDVPRQPLTSSNAITPRGFTNSAMQNATGKLGENVGKLPVDLGKQSQMPGIGQVTGVIDKVAGAFSALKQEKRLKKQAYQNRAVTDLQLKASQTKPEEIQRKYVRPEDIENTGEEFFPIYGVGTNQIDSARNGKLLKAQNGFSDFMSAGGTDFLNKSVNKIFENNAGAQFGSAAADVVGMIPGVGPIAKSIAGPILSTVGGLLDPNPKKIKRAQDATNRNIVGIQGNAMGQGIQQQYTSYMEDGGYIPQYRAGGHLKEYTPPSERAMETYALGGELYSPDGGLETVSQNPYLPNGGETVMLRGASHDNGGMPISYGENLVEAEGGEPITQLTDDNGETNAVIFGNLKINKENANMIGDKTAANKKMKNYVNELSKKENIANKRQEEGLTKIDNPRASLLDISTAKAINFGTNLTLKSIADKKEKVSALQNSINSTAEEFGLDADALAQGKYRKGKIAAEAKYGKELFKAQTGTNIVQTGYKKELPPVDEATYNNLKSLYDKAEKSKSKADVLTFQKEYHKVAPEYAQAVIDSEPLTNYGKQNKLSKNLSSNEDSLWGKRTMQYMSTLKQPTLQTAQPVDEQDGLQDGVDWQTGKDKTKADIVPIEADGMNPYMSMFNELLPWLRTRDTEALDPRQLYGEMYALSNNQLEPVSAQTYQPQLDVPYDISLQDIRNENQADYRSAQKMVGYNPAAQAMLNTQKYAANQKVGAEEFRMNQAMKDKVYSGNRATLNDAKLKNLAIYDQQYGRQAQAKSNTKAITQAALNSISSKYMQNQLENRKLQTMENLYNYRFDKNYHAINENPLAQWNTSLRDSDIKQGKDIPDGYEYIYNKSGEPIDIKKSSKEKSRNGSIIKSLKRI